MGPPGIQTLYHHCFVAVPHNFKRVAITLATATQNMRYSGCVPRTVITLTTETEFDVLEAKLGGSSGGAFFNECQTFLLSGILAGKTAFNAIAEKIFNPELACHLSKKGSHGRKIQLDGTMVLV